MSVSPSGGPLAGHGGERHPSDPASIDGPGEQPQVCVRCLVAGRVQGVFFRGATRQQAVRLGVTGYARNLADGRVEVLACGAPQAVAQLRDWLRGGPPQASVSGIAWEPVDVESPVGFAVD